MLLTLAVNDQTQAVIANGRRGKSLLQMPAFAIEKLELHGLNVYASALTGWNVEDLDTLRDRADKAACPCLVLVEDTPLNFASPRRKAREQSAERVRRLAAAANRLGCNSLAVSCEAPDTDDAFETTATQVRDAMVAVERLELNLLIAPHEGLTRDPDRLTDLIKRVGGFRIGSLPSFSHAADLDEPAEVLRKLAPYAGAIHASVFSFTRTGRHREYDLAKFVHAVRAVGFTNTLAIEYLGNDDPVPAIEQARNILQAAIDEAEAA